jgi:hypothetical protein
LPPGLNVDSSTGLISGTLPASAASITPYSVTATASDGTQTASQTFNWFVTNPDSVTLTNPGDQTNTEGDTVSLQLSASDANNATLTYDASGLPSGLAIDNSTGLISGTLASGDAAASPYTVTVSATDGYGFRTQQFIWNVNPTNLDPVVTNPGSQINTQGDVLSLPIQASDPPGNGLSYSATNLPPGLTINASSGLISGLLSNTSANGSPYTVTVTATDGSYSGSASFSWSVTNQSVTVTNPGPQTSTAGNVATLQIQASDPDGYTLSYSATGLPPGLSIDPSTGYISGQIDPTAFGPYGVTVQASDSAGNTGSAAFTWFVNGITIPPTVSNPGDQTNYTGQSVWLQLYANASLSATGLPPGLTLNQTTPIISGTLPPSAGSSTPYSVSLTASNSAGTDTETFNWYVIQDVVTLINPGDQTNTEGDTVSLQLSATDANNSTLTYQASGLPAGLSINTSTGVIAGTVAADAGTDTPYTVTVSATDSQGYSSSQQFNWNINGVLRMTSPGNQSNAEGDDVSLQIQASDDDGDFLEYDASGLPIGLWIDPSTGLISGTVDYTAAEISGGQYNITVTVNDADGQTVYQSFVWTITNTPQAPWLEYPEFQDSQTGTYASLQLVGGSPDGDPLTYSASALPSGLSVNSSTGLISGTITAAAGSYTVTATVTDTANNLSDSQTFTWQVTSGEAPKVLISFDGQPDGEDYLAGDTPTDSIPMQVTLENASAGLHTITLSIPSGKSSVNLSSFQLANGGSESLTLTPQEESTSFDDVLLVAYVDSLEAGDGKGTNDKVTIAGAQNGGRIRNEDTPPKMTQDRIPPRVATPVSVEVGPSLVGGDKTILYKITGASNVNGTAGFGDTDETTFGASGSLLLEGGKQTAPTADGKGGNAGNLHLVAYVYDKQTMKISDQLAKSAGFSVAAIPIEVVAQKPTNWHPQTLINNPMPGVVNWLVRWGPVYPLTFVSDSGNVRDLDAVNLGETLAIQGKPTGYYEAIGYKVPDKLGFSPITADRGGIDRQQLSPSVNANTEAAAIKASAEAIQKQLDKTPTGTLILSQTFVFADARIGTGTPLDPNQKGVVPILASGFQLEETIKKTNQGKYIYEVSRTAKDVGNVKGGGVAKGVGPVSTEIKVVPKAEKD